LSVHELQINPTLNDKDKIKEISLGLDTSAMVIEKTETIEQKEIKTDHLYM